MTKGTVTASEKYWRTENGRVFTELNTPTQWEYRTRILRLEQGYSLSETYLQPFTTSIRTL